jgi:Ni,Fe-hydrogenase maturation factor
MMIVCVVDGQGGKIGSVVIARLKERLKERIEIIALGTNSSATENMMKARANKGASGENAIITTVRKADIIIGTMNIFMADSMLGELTPRMAEAISASPALKFVLPVTQERVMVVGKQELSIPQMIGIVVDEVEKETDKCVK